MCSIFWCCVYLEKSERLKSTSRRHFFPQKLVVDDEVSVENKNRSQCSDFYVYESLVDLRHVHVIKL